MKSLQRLFSFVLDETVATVVPLSRFEMRPLLRQATHFRDNSLVSTLGLLQRSGFRTPKVFRVVWCFSCATIIKV